MSTFAVEGTNVTLQGGIGHRLDRYLLQSTLCIIAAACVSHEIDAGAR